MPKNIIYHNPRCSKSRQTLRILQERGADVEVIEDLKTPPRKGELNFVSIQLGITTERVIREKALFPSIGDHK